MNENWPEAIDRRSLTGEQPMKPSRWPRTERRQARIRSVLARRQPDLTVVLENIHDQHNVSAILRSCDAVGILDVHAVYTEESPPVHSFARETSASAAKWVDVTFYPSIPACFEHLRGAGYKIVGTALGGDARPLFGCDFRPPTAIVLGNEMRGISDDARRLADGLIAIPMAGMVQSLNVSVAAAVCLYEAFRQRLEHGSYARPRLQATELARLEEDWLKR